jgi:hypothetical protein
MSSLKHLFNRVYQYVLGYKNYDIRDMKATYEVLTDDPVPPGTFWSAQSLEKGDVKTVSIRRKNWRPVPKSIRIHVAFVEYWYNGVIYTHIIGGGDVGQWPPEKKKGLSAGELPIKRATLCDENDGILFDVTELVKKFAGPKCEYGFLRKIKKLNLVNILGVHSSILVAK